MRRFPLWLLIITILGIIPRVIFLITRGSFWFDELFTLELANMPFLETVRLASQDTNPPLWAIIMWPWAHLLPYTEWMMRLPALILGILIVPLVGLIGKKLASPAAGLIAAALVAASPTLIYFSTEARMYALFVFLTLLACYFLITEQRRAYYASLFLLLGAHLYAVIPAFVFYLWSVLTIEKTKRKTWHLWHGALAALFALWLVWSFASKLGDLASNSWFVHTEPRRGWPFSVLGSLTMVAGTLPAYAYWMLLIIVTGLTGYAVYQSIVKKQRALLLPITVLGIGFTVALLVGPAKIKYFLFVVPFVALLIGTVTVKWRAIALSFFIIIAIASTIELTKTFRFSWDRGAAFAAEQKDVAILIPWTVNALPFRHYYRGSATPFVIPAPGATDTSIQTLLAHNWRWDLKPDYLHEQLAALVPAAGSLLVVQSDPYVIGVREWLEQNGWVFKNQQTFDTMNSVQVESYSK